MSPAPGAPGGPDVELRGIVKRFGPVVANDAVDIRLRAGEVTALLGENGAGKTTLMNILAGLYVPDAGEIRIGGERVHFRSPRDAIARGIGMVHQQFELVDTFSTVENLALGRCGTWVPHARLASEIAELGRRLGLDVHPGALTWQLSTGERQRIEILRLLHRGARVLILDEPTSVLTPQEADALFGTLRRLAAEGRAVVVITHKLHEVMQVADRITVLRHGRVVAERLRAETEPRELARLMVGRDVERRREKPPARLGPVGLRLAGVCALGDRGREALREVSFEVRGGEILGVAGVAGNGQRELAEVIARLRRVTAGRIEIDGNDVTHRGALAAIRAGLGFVPEERLGMGLVPSLDLTDNLILRSYRQPPIGGRWRLNRRAASRWAEAVARQAQVVGASLDRPVRLLSGGNQQRLLLGREMAAQPRVLVATHPTRGLDVGATERVHEMLLDLRARGAALLLICEDLDEVLALADRVLVLFRGRVAGVRDTSEVSREEIGLLMGGGGEAATS